LRGELTPPALRSGALLGITVLFIRTAFFVKERGPRGELKKLNYEYPAESKNIGTVAAS
jgi:hypothetical protein